MCIRDSIKRLIKNAKLSDSSSFLGNIDYLPDRHLNRDLLESLADNDYIRQGLNVILIGSTGSDKSFIANALGINACQSGYKTRYIRLPELFSELEAARIQGKYHQVMKQFQKLPLVILDVYKRQWMSIVKITLYVQWSPRSGQKTGSSRLRESV